MNCCLSLLARSWTVQQSWDSTVTNLLESVVSLNRCSVDVTLYNDQQTPTSSNERTARLLALAAGSDANVDVTATSRRFLLLSAACRCDAEPAAAAAAAHWAVSFTHSLTPHPTSLTRQPKLSSGSSHHRQCMVTAVNATVPIIIYVQCVCVSVFEWTVQRISGSDLAPGYRCGTASCWLVEDHVRWRWYLLVCDEKDI